jgi:hypothetical protein
MQTICCLKTRLPAIQQWVELASLLNSQREGRKEVNEEWQVEFLQEQQPSSNA